MPTSTRNSVFWRGTIDAAPFLLVVGPFAILFGIVATEAGLRVLETMAFSVLVIGGASQFAAVSLMAEDAPTLIVLATALTVNLRMAMYSASMVPYLGAAPLWKRALVSYILLDQSYAVSILKFEKEPKMTVNERLLYFCGTMVLVAPLWYVFTWVGAVVGSQIPPEYAIDFALPITFIAMVAPMLRTPAHIVTAFVSVVGSLVLSVLPAGTGLLVAGVLAMIAGAQTELWMERRQKQKGVAE